jgi:electron transport complex protein RnfG
MSEPATATPPPTAAGPPLAPEPSSFSLIATLGLAGFCSGLAIVGVYMITLPMIERNRRERLESAILTVLPGSRSFKTFAERAGRLVPLSDAEAKQAGGDRIYAGYDEAGKLVGFALPGDEPGYQDTVYGILGFDPARKWIVGFQVLESRETPGLGDKIMSEAWLDRNFRALAVDPEIEAVAAGKKTEPNQVETITGATVSSKTVVRMLRETIARWRAQIEAYDADRRGD